MTTEEIEYHDWKVTSFTENAERKKKSIESYYLNRWYDEVADVTFKTYIYEIKSSIEEHVQRFYPSKNIWLDMRINHLKIAHIGSMYK